MFKACITQELFFRQKGVKGEGIWNVLIVISRVSGPVIGERGLLVRARGEERDIHDTHPNSRVRRFWIDIIIRLSKRGGNL